MAVQSTPPTQAPAGNDHHVVDDDRGFGWVMFAGLLLLMLGPLDLIEGGAETGNAQSFTANAHYITGSLKTWGWIVLCIGVLELVVGVGVFSKNQLSRWVGVVVLAGQAIVQRQMIPAYPFWSLSILTLDILAIYGLIAYGKRTPPRPDYPESTFAVGLGVMSVFFRSRRHQSPQDNPRVIGHSDAGIPDDTLRQAQQLQGWRRSAQRVTRAWNACLAADSRDRATRYRDFVAALADEERAAAEVERIVDHADGGARVNRVAAGSPGRPGSS